MKYWILSLECSMIPVCGCFLYWNVIDIFLYPAPADVHTLSYTMTMTCDKGSQDDIALSLWV